MILPDYWLERPKASIDETTRLEFEKLLTSVLSTDELTTIDYSLPNPKWQFLCYIADNYDILVHGSGNDKIKLFEPRKANDTSSFGDQKAVYAASDGIWAMFFAIVDREQFDMSIINGCIRVEDDAGVLHPHHYVFSVSQLAINEKPWRTGTIYLLPRKSFVDQPPHTLGTSKVHIHQHASFETVKPLAKLSVRPEDFPFLSKIVGHDESRGQEYTTALLNGEPWPEG